MLMLSDESMTRTSQENTSSVQDMVVVLTTDKTYMEERCRGKHRCTWLKQTIALHIYINSWSLFAWENTYLWCFFLWCCSFKNLRWPHMKDYKKKKHNTLILYDTTPANIPDIFYFKIQCFSAFSFHNLLYFARIIRIVFQQWSRSLVLIRFYWLLHQQN